MKETTACGIKDVCEARSHLFELTVFFEDLSQDTNLPSSLRSVAENALFELVDRYADLDMYFRFLIGSDPDLQSRQYKEF